MGFQKVAKREDLWSGEMIGLEVNGNRILLVNLDDHIYAYADACPHQNSRLCCARHRWEFDVCSGSGVNPQNVCLRRFPIRLDGEDILIDIDPVMDLKAAVEGEKYR
jgi:toluene monooxygenase system ferredoxin subunit